MRMVRAFTVSRLRLRRIKCTVLMSLLLELNQSGERLDCLVHSTYSLSLCLRRRLSTEMTIAPVERNLLLVFRFDISRATLSTSFVFTRG